MLVARWVLTDTREPSLRPLKIWVLIGHYDLLRIASPASLERHSLLPSIGPPLRIHPEVRALPVVPRLAHCPLTTVKGEHSDSSGGSRRGTQDRIVGGG